MICLSIKQYYSSISFDQLVFKDLGALIKSVKSDIIIYGHCLVECVKEVLP